MENQLIPWLERELEERGWSQRQLSQRAGISHTTVNQVLTGQRVPTWEFCAQIAVALRLPPDPIFVLAGLKRQAPAAVEEEREVLGILRSLSASSRRTVITMLRGLSAQVSALAEHGAPYEPDDELTRMLLKEFDGLPEEWKQTAIEQVQWVRRLAERPPVRILGEEQDGDAQRQATGTGD